MKMLASLLVVLIGVAAIVFGVIFMMQAGDARDRVASELAASQPPLTIAQVDAAYGQASAALRANTDPAQAIPLTLKKISLGLAQANVGTIRFVQNAGILNIVFGAGFVLVGLFMYMKRD